VTSQLIRLQAKEMAGIFYEGNQRSLRFRRENPVQDEYVAGHWPHFVDVAIQSLTALLHDQTVPQHQKDVIYQEICDHWDKSQNPNAREVLQATLQPREREDVRNVDASPELRSVGM
jgi:hypothetical protein